MNISVTWRHAKILTELFLVDVDVLTRKMMMSQFGGNYYLKRCQRCSLAFVLNIFPWQCAHNWMCWISQAETGKIGMQWLNLRVLKKPIANFNIMTDRMLLCEAKLSLCTRFHEERRRKMIVIFNSGIIWSKKPAYFYTRFDSFAFKSIEELKWFIYWTNQLITNFSPSFIAPLFLLRLLSSLFFSLFQHYRLFH